MKVRGILGGTLIAFVAAQPALAAQCATVSFSPANISIPGWDPITPAAKQATFTMTVTRLKTSTLGVRVMFLDSNDQSQPVRLGSNSAVSGPPYQVLNTSGINLLYPRNSQVSTLKGQATFTWDSKNSNNTQQQSFKVLVPANTANGDFPNGTYGETLNYAIQCLTNSDKDDGTDGPASGPALSLIIPNLVSLTSASPATLDFQNFTALSQQLNVGVKSTGPVVFKIESVNGMRMLRENAPAPVPDNSSIAYKILLLSQTITTSPTTLSTTPRAGVVGSSYPLKLELPSQPSGKVAGSYSDTITLTLTPQ